MKMHSTYYHSKSSYFTPAAQGSEHKQVRSSKAAQSNAVRLACRMLCEVTSWLQL